MNALTIPEAQLDMRRAYLSGMPGVAVSGGVWLVAAIVAVTVSPRAGVLALLVGGAGIFPLSLLLVKALGRPGAHTPGNPLGVLAMEGTIWMLAGIILAYATQLLRPDWFFPAMLLVIGGRYLTFQTLYGLKIYWVLGGILCATGFLLGIAAVAAPVAALAGAAVELVFAGLMYPRARKS